MLSRQLDILHQVAQNGESLLHGALTLEEKRMLKPVYMKRPISNTSVIRII